MMHDMEIREMKAEDLPQVAEIEKLTFSQPWSLRGFEDSLSASYTKYLVACRHQSDGDEILGYCGYMRSFEEADISNMAVKEAVRHLGIGEALLRRLMEDGRKEGVERYTLEVRVSNAPAVALYQKLGYKAEGVRKNFYALPTEDALIMWTEHTTGEKHA